MSGGMGPGPGLGRAFGGGGGGSPPSYVSRSYTTDNKAAWTGSGNGVITLNPNPTVGNLIVVLYTGATPSGSTSAPAVSDNQSNIVTQQEYIYAIASGFAVQCGIWTIPITTSSGSHTITINPAGSDASTYCSAMALEVSGQASAFLDAKISTDTTSTTPAAALGARGNANDLVAAVMTLIETGRTIGVGGTGWTQMWESDEGNATYQALNSIYKTFSSTGTENPAWTVSGAAAHCLCSAIAIKGA